MYVFIHVDQMRMCKESCLICCCRALESLKADGRSSKVWDTVSLAEVIKTLEDLIEYFAPPAEDQGKHSKPAQQV